MLANITFAVQVNGHVSNRISKTLEMSEDLFNSLLQAVYRRTGDAENWVKVNLFGLVTEQLGQIGSWSAVGVEITRR